MIGEDDANLRSSGPDSEPLQLSASESSVFISYSAADAEYSENLCRSLEARSIKCLMAPRDIPPGSNWGKAIFEAIEDASALVFVFSEASNQSPHVLREVERAVTRRKKLVPIRIADVMPSQDLEYFINACHWLDARNRPIHEYLPTLVQAIGTNKTSDRQAGPTSPTGKPQRPLWLVWLLFALVILGALYAASIFMNTKPTTVELKNPADGSSLLGSVSFQWDGEHLDPKNLAYEVSISAGNQTSFTQTFVRNTCTQSDLTGTVTWQVRPVWKRGGGKIDYGEWSEKRSFTVHRDALDRIRSTGIVMVGVSETGGLFVSQNGERLTGFDIEILHILLRDIKEFDAEKEEVKIEYTVLNWGDTYFGSLLNDESIDLLASGISATQEREAKYSLRFTNPHIRFPQVVVTLDGVDAFNCGHFTPRRLGAAAETTNADLGLRLVGGDSSRLKLYSEKGAAYDVILADIEAGVIDAGLLDKPYAIHKTRLISEARHVIFAMSDVTQEFVPDLEPENIAYALRPSDRRLLELLNAKLVHFAKERDDLEARYFGSASGAK